MPVFDGLHTRVNTLIYGSIRATAKRQPLASHTNARITQSLPPFE